MWLFLQNSFISIVQKPDDKDTLTVRARVKGDIARAFPGTKEKLGGGTDYAYRAKVPREVVAKTISDQIMALDYSNFKDSIADNEHHTFCAKVWGVAYSHQNRMGQVSAAKGKQKSLIG